MKHFCKIHFTILIILTLLLNGCTKKDPVENIIDNNIGHFTEVVNYAKDNFEQTKDVVYLENELDSCIIVLDSVKQAHYSQIDACESKINYWRLLSMFLSLVIAGVVFVKIKRFIK